MVPSEHQLARERGLNRHQARGILVSLAGKGYITRSQGRRSLVSGAWRREADPASIILALPGYNDDYTIALLRGFMQRMSGTEYVIRNLSLHGDEAGQAEQLRRLLDRPPRALAIYLSAVGGPSLDALRALQEAGVRAVLMDRALPGIEADVAVTDNEQLAHGIVSALCEEGHRQVAYVTDAPSSSLSSVHDRLAGCKRALAEYGVAFEDRFFVSCALEHRGHLHSLAYAMAYQDRPTALFCCNDSMAAEALHLLRALRYDVPGHVSMGMVNDGNYAAELHDVVSAEGFQDGLGVGGAAAELLLARLARPDAPVQMAYVPPLRVREAQFAH